MSVINNVLKDIENKPSAFTPLELAEVPDENTRKSFRPIAWLSGFLLLVILALVMYFAIQLELVSLNKDNRLAKSDEVASVVPVIIISEPKEVPFIANEEITGLQLNETKDFLELTLQLPLGAQSFLKKSSQNRYVFFISNAGKKVYAPDIKDNAWLKNITIEETELGLEIQFFTRDKVLIETLYQEKGQIYHWVIRLKKLMLAAPKEQLVKSVKKTEAMISTPVHGQKDVVKPEVVETKIIEEVKPPVKQVKLKISPVIMGDSETELLRKADVSIQQKSWGFAQKQLEELLNSSVDKKARIKLLSIYRIQENTQALKALLSKSLQLYPEDNTLLVVDAGQLFTESKYLTLIQRYQNKMDNLKIINFVAASFQRVNQHENAISYFQRSLKIDTQQPRQWVSLAISQEQLSKFERSVQSYKMALRSGSLNRRLQTFIQNRLQQLSSATAQ